MKRIMLAMSVLIIASMVLSACGGSDTEVTRVVTEKETVLETVVEKETVVEEKEVVVTATPVPTTLTMAVGGPHGFLDAQKIQSGNDLPHSDMLYSRLAYWDATMMDPVPELAESWTITEDADGGMTVVFKLREDVTFHTGRPFTAEDMVFSWDRSINTIGDLGRGAAELRDVTSFEATGPYEFTVKLGVVSPIFEAAMGHWGLAVVDKETIDDIDTNPVGTGPFRFVEWIPDDRLVLEKYEGYYDQETLARMPDKVVIILIKEQQTQVAALQAGEIDLIAAVGYQFLDTIRNTDRLRLIEQKGLTASYYTITFNYETGPTADRLVRQAFLYAIDRDAIHNIVFYGLGEPSCNFIPANHWAYMPIDCPERDVEKAKELLAEAGYPDGIKLNHKTGNNEIATNVAQVLQQSVAEAGIELDIILMEPAAYSEEVWRGKDYETSQAWYTREPDPDGLVQSVWRKGGGNNMMLYYNPEVEELFDQGKAILDPDQRKEIYKKIQEIVVLQDVPMVKVQAMPRYYASNYHVQGGYVNAKGYFNFKDYIYVP